MTLPSDDTRLLTIGHSNHSVSTFLDLLRLHQVTALADVRSVPFSGFNPQFNREALSAVLEKAGIRYVYLGEELGARRSEPDCYEGGQVRFDRVAKSPLFRRGLDRLQKGVEIYRVAMMCAEKDPLHCHRCMLICRFATPSLLPISHIREDGRLESHFAVETRLLQEFDLAVPNLFHSREELVEQAYEQHAAKVAYRAEEEEWDDAT